MATLLESYKNRVKLAEQVYAKSHNGMKMNEAKQIMVAKCIDNVSR